MPSVSHPCSAGASIDRDLAWPLAVPSGGPCANPPSRPCALPPRSPPVPIPGHRPGSDGWRGLPAPEATPQPTPALATVSAVVPALRDVPAMLPTVALWGTLFRIYQDEAVYEAPAFPHRTCSCALSAHVCGVDAILHQLHGEPADACGELYEVTSPVPRAGVCSRRHLKYCQQRLSGQEAKCRQGCMPPCSLNSAPHSAAWQTPKRRRSPEYASSSLLAWCTLPRRKPRYRIIRSVCHFWPGG
mmetsp:Transcript_79372/g.184184  ORF Transcript_79372/g.184184 Transcript_79372/m.184184 type:complete len:244 (+) Transcript_79372:1637-2368(+)